MSCRPPQILVVPYMKSGTPSAGTDRYVLESFVAEETIFAVEIDASSEIDCCIIAHSGGSFAYVAVGSPAVGPFDGPILVQPWRRVMPFSADGQSYTATPLIDNPPRLALKLHFQPPALFQTRRAPVFRSAEDPAVLGAGYSTLAEFPLFGFASARLAFSNGGSTGLIYRIRGFQYRAKAPASERSDDPVGWNGSTTNVPLSLNTSGATELTVAAGAQASVTFVGEPWETLLLDAKLSGAAGAAVVGIVYQAAGEI